MGGFVGIISDYVWIILGNGTECGSYYLGFRVLGFGFARYV